MRLLIAINPRSIRKAAARIDGLKWVAIALLICGIFFRFANIDDKFYWGDEVYTTIRISGYTKAAAIAQLYNGQIVPVEALDRYKAPNSEKTLKDAMQALMSRPEHPPLYFLTARFWMQFWMQWFSDPVPVLRSLSVLFSVAAFPAMYWLCLELFESPRIGWMALSLLAISPLHVLYAQEARHYSLWTLMTLLSGAALLRAMRRSTRRNWALYAVTLALGFYSHLFFTLVAVGQGIYAIAQEQFRVSKTILAYGRSLLLGLLAFTPWLGVILLRHDDFKDAVAEGQVLTSFSRLVNSWFVSINRAFLDTDLNSANIILVLFAAYAIYVLCRKTPVRVWLFVITLIGCTALPLIVTDLMFGSRRSVGTRYLIPCFVGIHLAFSYLFVTQMAQLKTWRQKAWRMGAIALILIGITACVFESQIDISWTKSKEKARFFIQAARIVNLAKSPLIVSDASPIDVLTFSYRLNPTVNFQLVTQPEKIVNKTSFKNQFDSLFLFSSSESLKQTFEHQFQTQPKLVVTRLKFNLWEFNPKNNIKTGF